MKIQCTIILFVSVFISISLKGQSPTFEFLLSGPRNERVSDIHESDNGEIYFAGFISKYPNYRIHRSGLIGKIDEYGQFIDSIVVRYPGMSFGFTTILPVEDSIFILDGMKTDTMGQMQNISIVLTKISSNLNIVETNEYVFPISYQAVHQFARKGLNNNLFVCGSIYLPPFRMFIYKFDKNLDSIKGRFYLNNSIDCAEIKEFNDGSLWILTDVQESYIMLDSAWYIISETDIPEYINGNYGLKWDTDTSFYLAGDWHPIPPIEDNNDIGIIRQFHPIDTTGHLFQSWGTEDTLDFPGLWGALDFKNKDSIFIGGTTNMYATYYGTWPSWYFVIQTDSMLNVRWERFYGGDAYYLMQKIIATNDGGCLIAGTRYDYLNATEEELDIHILKLNNEGLFVGNQNDINIEIREAIVFPNPGTNNIKVRIAAQYPVSTFELFDINGKQVLTEQITGKWGDINTSFLKAGTYIYRIHNTDGLFETGKWVKR